MLNKFKEFLKRDTLDFSEITYTLLKDFENYLSDFTRAKSMYLGEIRHLYREAMLEYNTDEETNSMKSIIVLVLKIYYFAHKYTIKIPK